MKIDENKYNRDWFYQKHVTEKLSTREIADIIGCSQSAVIKKLSKFNLKSNQSTQKVISEPDEATEPKPNLYVFGAKTFHIDPNDPSRQKKASEFRVQVLAENVVDALLKAEVEVRKLSNDFEFSLMNLFGSTVTIFPPRKSEK